MNRQLKFFGTAFGIFICYFYYGILQEAITKGKYVISSPNPDDPNQPVEEKTEPFVYTLSLVFVQCIVNFAYAYILLATFQKPVVKKSSNPTKSNDQSDNSIMKLYAVCSLTYLLAMITSNWALQWVPYPTQVIGKSCKPIPVMILGVLIGGRSYLLRKYLFILVIVVGVALFMYKPGKAASTVTQDNSATILGIGVGELLLLMSLSMDGLTGAVQERLRAAAGNKPNSSEMMKTMNLFGVIYTFIGLMLTGELYHFIQFTTRHPSVLWKILTFSVASALGQFFIFIMVSDFGPLPCSVVTTTRKFFTVLASVVLFGNVLSHLQWTGAALVFVGLGLDSIYGK